MKTQNTIDAIFKNEKSNEQNARNNIIFRAFFPSERYLIDFSEGFLKTDWKQYDTNQDAPYFGVWVNKTSLETLTYCEGDWTLVKCLTKENFNAEIENMIECYEPGYEFKTIGPEGLTIYEQDRKDFFV